MLIKVILYGYCTGVPSSRRIEKAMHEDIAFRYLGGGNLPDFRTISEFRRIHIHALVQLFKQVLVLCKESGLVKLGVVALDGTKIQGNASMARSRTYEHLQKEEDRLQKEIEEELKKGVRIDEEEDRIYGDRRGDEMPEGFQKRKERIAKVRRAKEEIERVRREKEKEHEERMAERERREKESGKKLRGRKLKPPNDCEGMKSNLTDPDSRIMHTRNGYIQGYNGQIVVDCDSQIILAADVTQDRNDVNQLNPMLEEVEENVGERPKNGTADAGYWSEGNVEHAPEGVNLYIATTKDWKECKALREKGPPRGRIPKDANAKERMERKLLTKKGRVIYKKRGSSVEPVFGRIKFCRGFTRFLLRGIEKVRGEWSLICMTENLLGLWRAGGGRAAVG